MVSTILPLIVTVVTSSLPAVPLRAKSIDPVSCMKANPQVIILAGKYPDDPKGPDPHGGDPNDEQHDPGLPANGDRKAHRAPQDPYGGDVPNQQAPY